MSFLKRKANNSTAQINLLPMVDCFTVLICYLLLTASFLSVSFLSTGVARPSGDLIPTESDYLTVSIQDEGRLLIQSAESSTEGPAKDKNDSKTVPAKKQGMVDFEAFSRFLEKLPKSYREIVLIPTPFTSYQTIVRLSEAVQKRSLSVVLSGEPIKGI